MLNILKATIRACLELGKELAVGEGSITCWSNNNNIKFYFTLFM